MSCPKELEEKLAAVNTAANFCEQRYEDLVRRLTGLIRDSLPYLKSAKRTCQRNYSIVDAANLHQIIKKFQAALAGIEEKG
jgi:hypothetical protein